MERAESRSVKLRNRGVLTLPKSLREKYDLGEGDALHLVDAGGAFVLPPMQPMVPSLSRKIEELREESGLSAEELLTRLQEERTTIANTRYGEAPASDENSTDSDSSERPGAVDE